MTVVRDRLQRTTGVRRSCPGAGGQGAIEFALVLPLFLLLLLALLDAGRVFFAQNTITEAARSAVRVGAVSPSYTQAKYDSIRNGAISASPGVPIAAANVTGEAGACPSGDADPSGTCFYPDNVTAGSLVVVNISVSVPLITPIIANVLGGSMTIGTHAVGLAQCTGC